MNTQAAVSEEFSPISARRFVEGNEAIVLADIYEQDCNMVAWRRDLDGGLQKTVESFLIQKPTFQASMTLSPDDAVESIHRALGDSDEFSLLSQDIAELVDMFCCLFDLQRAGLRITALTKAMCPKFHVDHVPCRMITTYQGAATEWLSHDCVDRSKLGRGSAGKSDEESGIYSSHTAIQQLSAGDVALLKGERWVGNEGGGLVHRSPALGQDEKRLLFTLDFA